MEVIDEEGRLFGVVNVVDALVVLLVLAVVIAGASLILGDGPDGSADRQTETRYVTLDFGAQPEYVVTQLREGMTAGGGSAGESLSISDVYVTGSGTEPSVVARVAVNGTANGDEFDYGGEPVQLGRELAFENRSFQATGTVVDVGGGAGLGTRQSTVSLEVRNAAPERANALRSGMTETVADRTLARVTEVETEPEPVVVENDEGELIVRDHPIRKRVTITADLSVRDTDSGVRYRGSRLQVGSEVTLDLGRTTVSATVVEVDES